MIKRALFKSLIITYGRCFTSSRARGTKLDERAVFEKATQQIIEWHTYMTGLRDNYIAHHSDSTREVNKLYFVIPPDKCPDKTPGIITTSEQITWLTEWDMIEMKKQLFMYWSMLGI